MLSLEYLALEVTRRCNEWCKVCMRGDSEDVDMSKEIVNKVLLDNSIHDIQTIMFTGGEPTLNEDFICYTIELIMKHHILVPRLSMVTNAKLFPKQILESFRDYQKYCFSQNIKSNIVIHFSMDAFHEDYPEITREYRVKYPEFQYYFKGLSFIWKTGRAEQGDPFSYKILPLYAQMGMGYLWVMNTLYVTAKGNYETLGDGMYSDMDRLHMGSVFDVSIFDLLERYGTVKKEEEEEFKQYLYRYKNH